MKKLVGFLSISLWAAALTFSPSPAQASISRYTANVNYFSCSQYSSISPNNCTTSGGDSYTFYGTMTHTIPLTACSGSCNGSEGLYTQFDLGNGRVIKCGYEGPCGNGYLLDLTQCNSCG